MRRFFPYFTYLKPVRLHFVLAIVCGVVASVASGFGLPFITSKVLPILFGADGPGDIVLIPVDGYAFLPSLIIPAAYALVFATILLPATFFVKGVCGFANTYLINYCGIRVLEQIRVRLFSKIQELPIAFFDKHKSGDIIARVMTNTNGIRMVVVNVANDLTKQPFEFIGAVGFLIWASVTQEEVFFLLLFQPLF